MTTATDEPTLRADEDPESFDSFFGKVSPPRTDGENLDVEKLWHSRAFGLAVALQDRGYFEWETFRQQLIDTIGEWDETHEATDEDWDYWTCWMQSLETLLEERDLLGEESLKDEVNAIMGRC